MLNPSYRSLELICKYKTYSKLEEHQPTGLILKYCYGILKTLNYIRRLRLICVIACSQRSAQNIYVYMYLRELN